MQHIKFLFLWATMAALGFLSIGLTLNLFILLDVLPTFTSPQQEESFVYTLTQRGVLAWAATLVPAVPLSLMIKKHWKHTLLLAPITVPPLYLCIVVLL